MNPKNLQNQHLYLVMKIFYKFLCFYLLNYNKGLTFVHH